jgi:hypothetical protein
MSANPDQVLVDLRKANLAYATLLPSSLTEEAITDIAFIARVPRERIVTFARYGRLNGVQELTAEDLAKFRARDEAIAERLRREKAEAEARQEEAVA